MRYIIQKAFKKTFPTHSPYFKPQDQLPVIKSPHPEKFFGRRDFGHTFKGLSCGLVCIVVALVSLCIFHTSPNTSQDEKVK